MIFNYPWVNGLHHDLNLGSYKLVGKKNDDINLRKVWSGQLWGELIGVVQLWKELRRRAITARKYRHACPGR